MKVRDVTKEVEADGWFFVRQKGSRKHYQHPTQKGTVTIAGHPGDDMPVGTLKRIYEQAQIKKP